MNVRVGAIQSLVYKCQKCRSSQGPPSPLVADGLRFIAGGTLVPRYRILTGYSISQLTRTTVVKVIKGPKFTHTCVDFILLLNPEKSPNTYESPINPVAGSGFS